MTNLKLPALSPNTKIVQDFSTSFIEVNYSRPSLRGRSIFGTFIPYGKIWRTGANAVTRITTGEDLEIAGQPVKAGTYALYTIPGEHTWEVILNTGVGNWGTGGYDTSGDVARFIVPVNTTDHTFRIFTIDFTDISFTGCNIELLWENTRIAIPVTAHNEARIDEQVEAVINNADAPHFLIATYYYEKNTLLDRAKIAIDKAIEAQPNAYFLWHTKAKVEKKLGNKHEATLAANKSTELAFGTPAADVFRHQNELLLADMN